MGGLKNRLLLKPYNKIIEFMKAYMPETRAKLAYYIAYKKHCNLNEPRTFSEKLLWLSLNVYRNNPLILKLSDKYLVREYIIENGYEEILNELYFVWEDIEQIDFEKLPDRFALKMSQGCQSNIICSNKNDMDLNLFKAIIRSWSSGQFLYDKMMADIGGIPVRKLKKYYICEKYLEQDGKDVPTDYKIYCFNGIPKAILVIDDRFKEKSGMFMTPEWTFLSALRGPYKTPEKPFAMPKSLNKMLDIAKKLSEPFPFVRVDLYDIHGKTIFGEMTFFPNGCIKMQEANIDGKSMGDLLDISKELEKQKCRSVS